MGGIDLVVTVRDEHERARRLHPPPEHSENVEGGLVSPVDVLEHEHGRPLELGDEDAAQLSRSGSGLDRSRDPTAGLSRTVASTRWQKARVSDVLPTPASPPTKRRRPPAECASASCPSSSSRSSSSTTRRSCPPGKRRSRKERGLEPRSFPLADV